MNSHKWVPLGPMEWGVIIKFRQAYYNPIYKEAIDLILTLFFDLIRTTAIPFNFCKSKSERETMRAIVSVYCLLVIALMCNIFLTRSGWPG